jgi:hypothetical protein
MIADRVAPKLKAVEIKQEDNNAASGVLINIISAAPAVRLISDEE